MGQALLTIWIAGDHTAIHAERRRDQRMAEQPAADLGKRQDARDSAVAFRIQIMTTMSQPLDDSAPCGSMKKGCRSGIADKRVPTLRVAGFHALDGATVGGGTIVRAIKHVASPQCAQSSAARSGTTGYTAGAEWMNSRSMRSNRKSRMSRSSRDSMRSRLR